MAGRNRVDGGTSMVADVVREFEAVRTQADPGTRASQLIAFAKAHDLTAPGARPIAEQISKWVDHPDGWLRHAVVFSLCFFRPVPGYDWILPIAWERASAVDIHWCAGAVGSAIQSPSPVIGALLAAMARRLVTQLAECERASHGTEVDGADAAFELRAVEESTAHACDALAQVLNVTNPPWATPPTDGRLLAVRQAEARRCPGLPR